jgi:uncharacterized membrane protein YdjX (TVP38/TMEM64 family)
MIIMPATYRKILSILFVIILGFLIVRFTPVGTYLNDLGQVKKDILSLGAWGYLAFILVYLLSSLLNIPGTAFMLLAFISFDNLIEGILLTYISSFLAAIATFQLGKWLGGSNSEMQQSPKIRKILQQAELQPIKTLVILRTLMQFSPLIGYSLSLTQIKTKDYIIGNLISLLIPLGYLTLAYIFLKNSLLHYFGL